MVGLIFLAALGGCFVAISQGLSKHPQEDTDEGMSHVRGRDSSDKADKA